MSIASSFIIHCTLKVAHEMTPFYSGRCLLTPALVRRDSTWPRGHFVLSSKYNLAPCLLLSATSEPCVHTRAPMCGCACGRLRDVTIKSAFLYDGDLFSVCVYAWKQIPINVWHHVKFDSFPRPIIKKKPNPEPEVDKQRRSAGLL